MRRLGIVLIGMGVVFGLAYWSWPGATPSRSATERRAMVRERFADRLAKLKDAPPAQAAAGELPTKRGKRARPAPSAPDPHVARLDEDKVRTLQVKRDGMDPDRSVADQVREVIDAPLEPPLHIDDDEVAENRAYWRKADDLGKLEGSLLNELRNRSDPYGKFEVQVALIEVYDARVETLSLYEAPSSWPEDRAERWHDKIEREIEATERKAAMLREVSEQEAALWPQDDPANERLRRLR